MKNKNSNRIAMIGPKEEVLPFIFLGAEVYATEDPQEARKALLDFINEKYPVIFVSDELLKTMEDVIKQYASYPVPCIASIPGRSGRMNFSRKNLNERIKKAVGIDIARFGEK